MVIVALDRFKLAYERLSPADRQAVTKALTIMADNPRHPSLRVRKMRTREDLWEASPSKRLRITFQLDGETIVLRAVGGHEVLKHP